MAVRMCSGWTHALLAPYGYLMATLATRCVTRVCIVRCAAWAGHLHEERGQLLQHALCWRGDRPGRKTLVELRCQRLGLPVPLRPAVGWRGGHGRRGRRARAEFDEQAGNVGQHTGDVMEPPQQIRLMERTYVLGLPLQLLRSRVQPLGGAALDVPKCPAMVRNGSFAASA